jgi:hypothetical protein
METPGPAICLTYEKIARQTEAADADSETRKKFLGCAAEQT